MLVNCTLNAIGLIHDGKPVKVESLGYNLADFQGKLIRTADFSTYDPSTIPDLPDGNEKQVWLAESKEHASAIFKIVFEESLCKEITVNVDVIYPRPDAAKDQDYKVFVNFEPEIKNFCPHDCHIYNDSGQIITTFAAEPYKDDNYWGRCKESIVFEKSVAGLLIKSTNYMLDNDAFPPYDPTYFQIWITSNITEFYMREATAFHGKFRSICAVYPTDLVRNEKKQIVGCKSLTTSAN